MARIHELLRQVRLTNAALADDIEREVDVLGARRAFGLNFERHTPEAVQLPGRPVRAGDKVHVLPPRGKRPKSANSKLWRVVAIEGTAHQRFAVLESHPTVMPAERAKAAVTDLVVVAEFRDPTYPGLVSTGKVERGGDKPFHTVINGENFHVLQALLFSHRGKVDAIYIDPPYNTGAPDWKYNNNYVEKEDLYRHSKWLAFMERRLILAKELLKSEDSVLMVTIDEKEYLRLGLLLEQTFPESKIQMISTVINPGGASRSVEFTRVNEFVYMVMIGNAAPRKTESDMLFTAHKSALENRSPIWRGLLRGGSGPLRRDSPSKFFPILVEPSTLRVVGAGGPLPLGADRLDYSVPDGLLAVWPLKTGGVEGRWELSRETFDERHALGYVRAGKMNRALGQPTIYYLRNAEMERLANGELVSAGLNDLGFLQIDYAEDKSRTLYAKTVWNQPSHDAGTHGSALVKKLLGGRAFPFPKSLYAVEDSLRQFVIDRPEAVILDFFSGSGTTAHAVMRLNKQDGGRRLSISVTNNEVSSEEQKRLREEHLRPGEPDWEKWGICEYITKPRIRAAITGLAPSGEAVKGNYKFIDEFPMAEGFEENIEFLTLTYEAPLRLRANRDFSKVAPLLWLRAGSRGPRIESLPAGWDVSSTYGVIADLDKTEEFLRALVAAPEATTAFVITDDDGLFEAIVAVLPERVEPVRLYDAYFRNFEIDAMRSVR